MISEGSQSRPHIYYMIPFIYYVRTGKSIATVAGGSCLELGKMSGWGDNSQRVWGFLLR